MSVLAVDIGGSGVRAARLDAAGRPGPVVTAELRAAMDRAELLGVVGSTLAAAGVGGAVGIAVPGFVGPDGRLRHVTNLPALDGVDLAVELPAAGGVTVVPDLAAAAVAEARLGAGRAAERVLCVALGTGANAALVAGGVIVPTAYGCLGDAGHVVVEPDGPRCACGGRGCLEAIASGSALARAGARIGHPDAPAVVAAAHAAEPAAAAVVRRAGVALGRAIVSWSVMTFPDIVVIGGGVALAGELLLGPARDEVRRLGAPYVVQRLRIVPAELARNATLIGAGLAARDRDAVPA